MIMYEERLEVLIFWKPNMLRLNLTIVTSHGKVQVTELDRGIGKGWNRYKNAVIEPELEPKKFEKQFQNGNRFQRKLGTFPLLIVTLVEQPCKHYKNRF